MTFDRPSLKSIMASVWCSLLGFSVFHALFQFLCHFYKQSLMLLFNTLVRATAELISVWSQAQKIRHIVPLFVALAIVGSSVLNLIMCPQIENVANNQSFSPIPLFFNVTNFNVCYKNNLKTLMKRMFIRIYIFEVLLAFI